jgi:ketosteroid isomerase-like protein
MKMKKNTVFIVMFILVTGIFARAQNSDPVGAIEREIRRLDAAAAEAVLRKDFEALDRLCAEDFITNSPRNVIVKGREALKDLIRSGVIDYARFKREIETVLISADTAIVMGREMIVTKARAGQTEQNQTRRYTNIWIKKGGKWLLTARHASIIYPNQKNFPG